MSISSNVSINISGTVSSQAADPLAKRSATAQKRDSLSMGVYGFLSEDGSDDADEAERFQRSEQQERILPQHELHAHPIVQVGAILSLLMKIRVCTFSTFLVSAHVVMLFNVSSGDQGSAEEQG